MPHIKGSSEIDWHFEVEGEGEVLFFIHGWGVDRRIWRQQTKYFVQNFKVVAVDLPGHGDTTWKKIPFESMAQDILQALDILGIKQVNLIGSSLGGMLGMKVYGLDPGRFKRIILVGSMPKFAKSEDYPYGLDVQNIRKLNTQLGLSYPMIVNIFFRSLFTKEERESRRFKWLQKFRQTDAIPLKTALSEYLDVLEKEDVREVFKNINIPIQSINGVEDYICSRETVEYMRKIQPRADFQDFPLCGHFPFLSKPYEFNEIVEKFIRST